MALDIVERLLGVSDTLIWGLVLAGVAVFAYFVIKWFQGDREETSAFEKMRLVIVFLPMIWVFFNFNSDSNALAESLFGSWLPFCLIAIVALGIAELATEQYMAAREIGEKEIKGYYRLWRRKR